VKLTLLGTGAGRNNQFMVGARPDIGDALYTLV
jgi:hypothetical protein